MPTGLLHALLIPTSRFTSLSIDFIIDYPLSQGYNAIFVCVDYLTKYTKLILCFMGEDPLIAEQVALLFFQNIVQYFGIPISVIHYTDPRFSSDNWKSLWKLFGSHAIATSACDPQANGQTECIYHTIGKILRAHLLYEDQEHWPDHVDVTEMAINSTINAIINKAPFKVLYSKNTPLPVNLLLSREFSISPHAYSFAIKMKQLVNKVKNSMHDA